MYYARTPRYPRHQQDDFNRPTDYKLTSTGLRTTDRRQRHFSVRPSTHPNHESAPQPRGHSQRATGDNRQHFSSSHSRIGYPRTCVYAYSLLRSSKRSPGRDVSDHRQWFAPSTGEAGPTRICLGLTPHWNHAGQGNQARLPAHTAPDTNAANHRARQSHGDRLLDLSTGSTYVAHSFV